MRGILKGNLGIVVDKAETECDVLALRLLGFSRLFRCFMVSESVS